MKTNIYAIKGNTLGNPDGKIVIYLYSDFLLPFCKVTNTMAHKLAKKKKDIIIYHINFPLDMKCNPVIKKYDTPWSLHMLQDMHLLLKNKGHIGIWQVPYMIICRLMRMLF